MAARGSNAWLWACSGLFSMLCLGGLVVSWHLVATDEDRRVYIGTPITNPTDTERYLRTTPTSASAVRIPTGVFVQSVEFATGNNVKLTGYVWQRYGPDVPRDVTRGIVLPEAEDAYPKEVAFREHYGDTEVIGWYFKANLRQNFDYRKYPLDHQDIWLRMWHPNFDRVVVLVPDFAAYPPWDAHRLIGLDRESVFVEWAPTSTTFSYFRNDYTTNFGHGTYAESQSFPELYYNLGVSRRFHGPLFDTLIPITFIALLVFAALFVTTRNEDRRPVVGFTTFAVISFAVSMLLVVAVRQADIRADTSSRGIVYLEYFSFAMYSMILLVATNAILVTSARVRILEWRENLLPRLLYWPLLLGSLLTATLLVLAR